MGFGIRLTTSKLGMAFGAALTGLLTASAASAQPPPPPSFQCQELPHHPDPDLPVLKPIFRSMTDLSEDEFDCLAWQDFIYLMWPAQANQRGVPDPNRKIGASGPTVWESYRTADTVFLPEGRDPGPWQQLELMATLQPSLAQQVASGAVRNLTQTAKVSRGVMSTILQNAAAFPPPILNGISQAGGGTLYDLNGFPVYYEVAMDKAQYDYIHDHQLYNAYRQAVYARTNVISLPAGTKENQLGAVEVKAAWKVLTDAERHSGRFHTIQALLGGAKSPVTVGLVGFHVFVVNGVQGAWATFAQMDNAPSVNPATSGHFNFFNPNCKIPGSDKPCPVNVKDADPGQVLQVTPDAAAATKLNTYMHYILQQADAKSPWQYYNLIDVQWALDPKLLSGLTPPASVPLPNGTPNIPAVNKDFLNPVLETFLQLPYPRLLGRLTPGNSCLGCHQYATTAAVGIQQPPYATGYSFMLGRATALPTDAP
jgi:hypothetical protein